MRLQVIICFLFTFFAISKAQVLNDFIELDSVIVKNNNIAYLDSVKQDSVKFKQLDYYFKKSFILEYIACSNCQKFDPTFFSVLPYEMFREGKSRYVRVYDKYGFKLTLLSLDELEFVLPFQEKD
jgi:hypothetical protein